MRRTLFFIVVMVMVISTAKGQDRITFRNGETVKRCTIVAIDTARMEMLYQEGGVNVKVPINTIASYSWNDVVNGGMPVRASARPQVDGSVTPSLAFVPQTGGAGMYLVKFSNRAQLGLGVIIAGGLVSAAASLVRYEGEDIALLRKKMRAVNTIRIIGTGVSIVGGIIFISSFSQAREAGIVIDRQSNARLGVTPDGIGVTMPIR